MTEAPETVRVVCDHCHYTGPGEDPKDWPLLNGVLAECPECHTSILVPYEAIETQGET